MLPGSGYGYGTPVFWGWFDHIDHGGGAPGRRRVIPGRTEVIEGEVPLKGTLGINVFESLDLKGTLGVDEAEEILMLGTLKTETESSIMMEGKSKISDDLIYLLILDDEE